MLACGTWSVWGISGIPEQGDAVGAILFCVFLIYLFKGRSPLVYLGAFFITTWLELIGTAAGTWRWVELEPIFGLPQGNPPSGVAAWYCLVDAARNWRSSYIIKVDSKEVTNGLQKDLERESLRKQRKMNKCVMVQNRI